MYQSMTTPQPTTTREQLTEALSLAARVGTYEVIDVAGEHLVLRGGDEAGYRPRAHTTFATADDLDAYAAELFDAARVLIAAAFELRASNV
jgi:hypothetical protein